MTDSNRVPGYPMRYVAAKKLDDDMKESAHQYDVNGNGERGIDVRTAKPKDAQRAPQGKPSSLS